MLEHLPVEVEIIEVGPRDGLQNEKKIVPTEDKYTFISKLVDAGIKKIEVTSFVKPPAIPQMADSKELYLKVAKQFGSRGLDLSCLVPNSYGLNEALSVGVKHISLFNATSETFSRKNVNASPAEVDQKISEIVAIAKSNGLVMRGYVSTVFGCPYEGDIAVDKVVEVVQWFLSKGITDISLGDTIGVANPAKVKAVVSALKKIIPLQNLAMHFHDTRGTALVNILTSLELGITKYDSSAGGLGGCPYAKGATGNVATEDVLYLMHSLGVKTGVDLDKIACASEFILNVLEKETPSKFLNVYFKNGKKKLGCS